jgi:hypothetical protein
LQYETNEYLQDVNIEDYGLEPVVIYQVKNGDDHRHQPSTDIQNNEKDVNGRHVWLLSSRNTTKKQKRRKERAVKAVDSFRFGEHSQPGLVRTTSFFPFSFSFI